MNLKMLSWFLFFFLFLHLVLRSACDPTFTLAHAAGSELSENNGGTQSEGPNARIEIDKETMERISEEVKMVHTKIRKGSVLSSRNLPRPHHSGVASTYLARSSLVIGVVLQVSIGLLQVFSFFL